jgi:hypothetical protein
MKIKNMQRLNRKILLIILLIPKTIFSQNYSCKGSVTDFVFDDPLSYATVQLLNSSDSTLYAGAITDGQGEFLIHSLIGGDYICRISYVGYYKQDINLSIQEKRVVDLGKIVLIPSQSILEEVSITDQTSVRDKIDRAIYWVDSAMLANVTMCAELLSKIPELQVNKINETVIIKGKENTTVMMNGVLTSTNVDIRIVNPQDIEQIEIITAPASEYGTDIDGIVNIILKEKIDMGYSFDIGGSWNSPPWNRLGEDLIFHYNAKKIRFASAYWYRNGNEKSQYDTIYRESYDQDNNLSIYQFYENPNKKRTQNHTFENNIEFYPNKKNYLNLFTKNNISLSSSKLYGLTTQKYFNDIPETTFSFSDKKDNYNTGNYTLFYRRKFNKEDHNFTANFNFYHLHATENAQYKESKIIDSLLDFPYMRKDDLDASRYSYNLKLDYYNPISEKFDICTGALGYYQKFLNDYKDGGFSDTTYHYSIFKSHYYIDISFSWRNVGIRIGNKIEGYYAYMNGKSCAKQWSYLPSLGVLHKINIAHTMRFNYRAVNYYPNAWMFNPYRVYSADSLTAYEGNPNIKPATRHNLSLEYLYRKSIFSIQANASYQYLHNGFLYEPELDQQNVLVFYPNNISRKSTFSFYLNSSLDFDFLYISYFINFYYEYFNKKSNNSKNFDCDINVYAELYLPYDFEINVDFSCYGKRLSLQGYSRLAPSVDIFAAKNFFNKKAMLKIGYSILPYRNISVIEQLNLYQWQQYNINSTGFYIAFRYSFRKGKEYRAERIERYLDFDPKSR